MIDPALSFVVTGPPAVKRRHRTAHTRTYTPKKTVAEELTIRRAGIAAVLQWRSIAQKRWNATQRFRLSIDYFAQDARTRDLTNMVKAIEDGLNGIAWDDDSQIDSLRIERYFTVRDEDDGERRTEITIQALPSGRL